jgi:hypothetical protein
VKSAGLQTGLWPLLERGKGVLAVTGGGLHIFSPDGDIAYPWSGLAEVAVEPYALVVREKDSSEETRFLLTTRSLGRSIEEAIVASGGPLDRQRHERGDDEQRASLTVSQTSTGHRERSAVESTSHSAGGAAEAFTLLMLLSIGGVAAEFIGGVIIGIGWPRTSSVYDTLAARSTSVHHGSVAAVVVGGVIAWAGSLAILVSAVGWGVMLGVKAGREN